MIPGNNDALTSFVECVALCNSQSRVGVQYVFVKHAVIPHSLPCFNPGNYRF